VRPLESPYFGTVYDDHAVPDRFLLVPGRAESFLVDESDNVKTRLKDAVPVGT